MSGGDSGSSSGFVSRFIAGAPDLSGSAGWSVKPGMPVSFCQSGSAPRVGDCSRWASCPGRNQWLPATFALSALRTRCFRSELNCQRGQRHRQEFLFHVEHQLGAGADYGVRNLFGLPINNKVLDMPQVFVALVADIHAEDAAGLVELSRRRRPSVVLGFRHMFSLKRLRQPSVRPVCRPLLWSQGPEPGKAGPPSKASRHFLLRIFIELAFVFGSRFVWFLWSPPDSSDKVCRVRQGARHMFRITNTSHKHSRCQLGLTAVPGSGYPAVGIDTVVPIAQRFREPAVSAGRGSARDFAPMLASLAILFLLQPAATAREGDPG